MTTNQMINTIKNAKANYHQIDKIIDDETLLKWTNVIKKYSNPIIYVQSVKYNLLTVLFVSNYEIQHKTEFEPYKHAVRIIESLNTYLDCFPNLVSNLSFLSKIRNIDGFNFLSTMSELSVAQNFKNQGWIVDFEEKYTKTSGALTKNKDIDIKITNKFGQTVFLEVYTPNEQTDIQGFFNPFEYNDKLNRKLDAKAYDKFTDINDGDLNGKRILIANTLYSDTFSINRGLSNIEDFFNKLVYVIPDEMDAIILFEDDFSSINSFTEIKTIIKNYCG